MSGLKEIRLGASDDDQGQLIYSYEPENKGCSLRS